MSYSSTILAESSLVSYWQLNETSGTTANDFKGSNNGTYSGGFTLNQSGQIGSSVLFNGSTGYVSIPDATNLHLSAPFSLEIWYKGSVVSNSPSILNKYPNSSPFPGYSIELNTSGNIRFWVGDNSNSYLTSTIKVIDNNWYHIVCTISGTTANIYINGILNVTGSRTPSLSNTANAYIGSAFGTTGFLNGSIQHLALYNSALSSSDIQSHFFLGNSGPVPVASSYDNTVLADSPVSYWPLSESSGGEIFDLEDSNNGSVIGGCTLGQFYTPNGIGAILFNGSTGLIAINDATNLHISAPLSVEAWYKGGAVGATYFPLFQKYSSVSPFPGFGLGIGVGGGSKAAFWVGDNTGGWSQGVTSLGDNLWHHIVATLSGTTVLIYVDGVLDSTNTRTPSLSNTVNAFIASEFGSGSFLSGQVASVAVYNYVLTSTQIANHYNANILSFYFRPVISSKSLQPSLLPRWRDRLVCGYALASNTKDLVGLHNGALLNSTSWSNGLYGPELKFVDNGSSSPGLSLGALPVLSGVTELTISVLCLLNTYTDAPNAVNIRYLYGHERNGAGSPSAALYYQASTKLIIFAINYNTYQVSCSAPPLNKYILITGRVTSTSLMSIWFGQDKMVETLRSGASYPTDATTFAPVFGSNIVTGGRNWSGSIVTAYLALRGFQDQEIINLANDPFAPSRNPKMSVSILRGANPISPLKRIPLNALRHTSELVGV